MASTITHVEGTTTLEIPGGRPVDCSFEIDANGDIAIRFKDETLADFLASEAVLNRLVALGLHYVAAEPRTGEERRIG